MALIRGEREEMYDFSGAVGIESSWQVWISG